MAIPRDVFMEVLKDSYSAYYSIDETAETELPLAFRATYQSRDELFFFVKSANIWGNEKNEFAYVFSAPSFSPDEVKACVDYALADGLPRVKPHSEHQCTNIKVVFIAETAAEDSISAVEKQSFTKNYKFGLHGFTNLLTGIVDLSTQKTCTNKTGHELVPYFKKLFAARGDSDTN